MDILYIVWRDCTHLPEGAIEKREIEETELLEMHDVGFVIYEDKTKIAIAMEYIIDQAQARHVSWIPKVNIVKKIRLGKLAKKITKSRQ